MSAQSNTRINTRALLLSVGFLLCVLLIVLYFPSLSLDIRNRAAYISKSSGIVASLPAPLIESFTPRGTFSISETNSTQSDWTTKTGETIDEKQVFWKRIDHTQPDGKNWIIKIGKGGQIYSMSTPQTGEMIAKQRLSHGQWVDEIFQHVIISKHSRNNATVDGDIHQAGYYTKSDIDPNTEIIPKSIYSPTFSPILKQFITANQDEKIDNISFITWPQHAHLPRTYSENGMLMHENIRDLGDGVVEITLVIDKWSGELTEAINIPWIGLRTETLPSQIVSVPNGNYKTDPQIFSESEAKYFNKKETNGWIAFTQSENATSYGIGLVYGKKTYVSEGVSSYVRWGTYTGSEGDGTIATVKRDFSLQPGDSIYFRYYLVFGQLKDIQRYGNLLSDKVQFGRIEPDENNQNTLSICSLGPTILRRACPDPSQVLFIINREHIAGSKPLFLLQNVSTKETILTTNPYTISNDPTDLSTRYLNFFGWVHDSQKSFPSNLQRCVHSIASYMSAVPGIIVDASLNSVWAPNSVTCQ